MSHRYFSNLPRTLKPVLVSMAICSGNCALATELTQLPTDARRGTDVDLHATIEQTLLQQATQRYPDDEVTVDVMPINPVLVKKPCNEPAITVTGQQLTGRVSAHIKCADPQAWAFYASAKVTVQTIVTVPSRNILRGELISVSMLNREKRDRDSLRLGYITSAKDIVGRKASRSLRAQQPIYPHQIVVPHAVVSGDHVQIMAQRSTISIRSAGIALEDGHVGDQIRVRNSASERLLNLWVWDNGVVGTRPQKVQRGG